MKYLLISILFLTISCNGPQSENTVSAKPDTAQNESLFKATMQKHLDAVSNKDYDALTSTMSPEGKMQLILPGSEIIDSVQNFMNFHKTWFADTSGWTFETKILNTEVGEKIGIAVTEIVYREPDRKGKPYFNRMIVSYALEKIGDKWYIIKDHASSIEKSTDNPN